MEDAILILKGGKGSLSEYLIKEEKICQPQKCQNVPLIIRVFSIHMNTKEEICIWEGDLYYSATCESGKSKLGIDVSRERQITCEYCGKKIKYVSAKSSYRGELNPKRSLHHFLNFWSAFFLLSIPSSFLTSTIP